MSDSIRHGDVLANRYLLIDLLSESRGGRFWRAHDRVLSRHVALHVIPQDDERAAGLLDAAKRSATVSDRRLLRVLDADIRDELVYVVNEWGAGTSLDVMLANDGPLSPRRAAWITSEVGAALANAHAADVAHGRLVPENVLVDHSGSVRVIGLAVDAALQGLPDGRVSTDVVDLAGVLYAAMTGKWPGISRSGVPSAPDQTGRVLRPRKVRAGVPKVLDEICDEVLNPYAEHTHGLNSAAALATALREFVGDSATMAAQEAASHRESTLPAGPAVSYPPGSLPVTQPVSRPETAPVSTHPVGHEPTELDPQTGDLPEPDDASRARQLELETQAGIPDWDDPLTGPADLSWLEKRSDPPPPPPPLQEPAARPLFAPDPPPGEPVRRPRYLTDSSGSGERVAEGGNGNGYWPWENAGPPPPGPDNVEPEEVPGRNWLRLAGVILAVLLLVLAVLFAFNLGRDSGSDPPADSGQDDPTTSAPAQEPKPVQIVGAEAFDPLGDPPNDENGELVPNVYDGNPTSQWHTSSYQDNIGDRPRSLKPGVGLILDLGEAHDVRAVEVAFDTAPTTAQVFVGDSAPGSVDDLGDPTGEGTADGDLLTLEFEEPVSGRYITVWLTSLPPDRADFRGVINEIRVLA
ncbi:protein kinase family protein [Nocardioides speluncae]|uniref:protein kinase family protein n=1 Tax=Nocardioides speluncae TaxID=2670337 RepID=UPI00137984F2|nr:protein kinase family protein [Nocardioides speluncae]